MLKTKSGRSFPIQDIVLLHFVIFSLGLLKLNWFISKFLYSRFHLQSLINQLCDWIVPFHNDKLIKLLFYSLSILGFFVCCAGYALTIFCLNRRKKLPQLFTNKQWKFYFVLILAMNAVLILIPGLGILVLKRIVILVVGLWLIGFLTLPLFYAWPTLHYYSSKFNSKIKLNALGCWLLTALITSIFLYIFYPMLFKPLQITNEFMSIPEKTFLSSSVVVDNTQYINAHHIGGLDLYDPRQEGSHLAASKDLVKISIPQDPRLEVFLSQHSHNLYDYNVMTHELSLKGKMKEKDYQRLLSIYLEPVQQEAIHQLFIVSNQHETFYKTRGYTPEEHDFIIKNRFELNNKIKAGWFFFHHSWVLNPLLAWSSYADPKHQTFIYGWGSAFFLKTMLMNLDGNINFQNYFKWTLAFYPLYFVTFLLAIYGIFRRADYVCVGAILLSASVLLLGEQMILMAPGYNPMRHFFDMSILVLFFLYLKNARIGYLIVSFLLSFVSIVWSKDFGLFLLLSLCMTGFVNSISSNKGSYAKTFIFCGAALLGLALYFIPNYGVNHNLIYMLLGYTIPGTSIVKLSFILLTILSMYIFYLKYAQIRTAYFWLSLCLFFYVQLQLIYYIWYPSYQHLLVSAPALMTLGMLWARIYGSHGSRKNEKPGLGLLSCSVLAGLYGFSLLTYFLSQINVDKDFTYHPVYHWSFPTANFRTTMDPQLFEESVRLIHKYIPQQSSMYLLSQYDAILPVLAQRYNALPVINLALDLIGQRDIERCLAVIDSNKPLYLFIDTDIVRDFRGDVFSKSDLLGIQTYEESRGRYSVLKNMRNLYAKVIGDYQPVEKGHLITVYKRKTTQTSNLPVSAQ